nr:MULTISPECIES: YdaS family helix-turn-helix protein [unclassified Halomonas]
MTAYDLGKKPVMAGQAIGRYSAADRAWRRDLLISACRRLGGQRRIAEYLETRESHVSRWMHDVRPVPDRYVPALIVIVEMEVAA